MMTRRWFLQALGLIKTVNCSSGGGDEHLMECAHSWTKGPFYVTAAGSFEEPSYYPPAHLYSIEHCEECGVIRLPKEARQFNGSNIAAGHHKK